MKTKILELAKDLIQESGANAFSYQDLANVLGIKKASIHYYFPHKDDLLIELVEFYSSELEKFLSMISKTSSEPDLEMDEYLKMYEGISSSENKLCLCGILAGEIVTLSPLLREKINKFFVLQETWLIKILMEGESAKKFNLKGASPDSVAKTILASLQGALVIARSLHDPSFFKQVLKQVRENYEK